MLPRIPLRFGAALAALALAALAAACELDGASKRRAESSRNAGEAAARGPRTNLPLPPVATSHGTTSTSVPSPRGSWTQLDGRRAGLEDLRGQVVVLDFWATYCPPCREEIPHLVRLQKQLGPKGLKVIGLNVGGPKDRPMVPEFVREYGIQYQLADPDDDTVRLFMPTDDSIPQTFVIDRRGRLVRSFVGYDSEVAAELERTVSEALAEKAD